MQQGGRREQLADEEHAACVRRDRCPAAHPDEGEAAAEGTAGRSEEAARPAGDSGWCGFGPTGRVEVHQLIQMLLHEPEPRASGAAWQQTSYKLQCERMLAAVPHTPQGLWARRTHVFREVPDVPL